mmetsp:Transcript_2034/g.1833  ORF Transcript_2034/g.1833 Transcript_2034/m.1833 type:complete len:388 (+) Transcript_2034:53-1216(+)
MTQYKITSGGNVLDGRHEAGDHELNDAALKSLDVENFTRKQIIDDYRKDFVEDYNHKQEIKKTEHMKGQRAKEDYVRMCQDNSAKEIQNEQKFKQKFIDINKKQNHINKKFQETVLKDYSSRNCEKESITASKPAYYDKLEGEYNKYMNDKEIKMKSTWKFQKDRIHEKYKKLSKNPQSKTEMGLQSYGEYKKFESEQKKEKEENKERQSIYAGLLKNQVDIKKTGKVGLEVDKPNHVYLGKYKLNKNSSLPMIPGIHSDSSLTGIGPVDSYNIKFKGKGNRASYETLEGMNKTRNLLNSYKTTIPNSKFNSGMKLSRNTLRKSGLSTLESTDKGKSRYVTANNDLYSSMKGSPEYQNLKISNLSTRVNMSYLNPGVSDTFKTTFEF